MAGMSSDEEDRAKLERFLAEDCPECGAPGPQRHLSVVNGCRTCAENNPWPVHTPQRLVPSGWRVRR
jgi:RNA polymerase-binding transcription factor DksA